MKKTFRLIITMPVIMGLFACSPAGETAFHSCMWLIPGCYENTIGKIYEKDEQPACSKNEQAMYEKLDDYTLCREFYDGNTEQCLEQELKSRFAQKDGIDHCIQVLEN